MFVANLKLIIMDTKKLKFIIFSISLLTFSTRVFSDEDRLILGEQNIPATSRGEVSDGNAMSFRENIHRPSVISTQCVFEFNPPINQIDLLLNLKRYLSENYFLEDRFYSAACIKDMLGATGSEISSGLGSESEPAWVIGGEFGVQKGAHGRTAFGEKFSATFRSRHGNQPRQGGVDLIFSKHSSVTYEDVIRIFGNSWELDKAPPPDGPLLPALAKHGNEHFTQEMVAHGVVYHAEIIFNRTGYLFNISMQAIDGK
ncbi:hypothetical protein [Burkholderia sp. JKS000303]|uniref:hypothetical protein n=1 Tax=Burkholderia sp. JKS000303 TaxID=1938747 RepID=UPI000C00DB0B|nr:hypothetical protein [Burkholderia sp. JKS000303]PFH20546.1 hypothetical protein BX604_4943 [Burkholderia sp. JKS000303]